MSEGSVFCRKDGKWCAKWKDADGKWRYLYRKSKAEAKRALREALKDRDDNIVPADKLTLSDAMDAWIDGMQDTVAPRTYINRESVVRIHVKSHPIGNKKLCKLTPEHLRAFYRERLTKVSPATIGRIHNVINSACREQVKAKRLRTNPAAEVKPPKNPRKEMEVLTAEQVKHLLATIRGSRYEVITVLGATCALRVGEALAIRYEDVDLVAGTISVKRTLWRGKAYPPKTPSSHRTLTLPQVALEALTRHSERHGNPTEGYLLSTSNGTPVAPENFWRWGFKPALRKAGLPESVTFHQLRHGCISLLIQQQVPIPIISKYAGHSNPAITYALYSHVISGTSGMAATGIDNVLS